MPKMRSSNQCQGQLSCGRSHNKSRLLWLESEAPPREAGKLLGISKVSFLSLSLCVYLSKLPETLCVGTEYLRWVWETTKGVLSWEQSIAFILISAGAMLQGCVVMIGPVCHNLLLSLISFPNTLLVAILWFLTGKGKLRWLNAGTLTPQ